MTGIERLREFVAGISPDIAVCGVTTTSYDSEHMEEVRARLRDYLADIAGQIEREQGGRVSRMRVLSVVSDMEHHILGHEGMEDSPVVRWARELRRALGGDGHDPAKDVSVSAYDLLPQEDREAIAWVRDHGWLDAVKRRWECLSYYADPVPRSCMEKRLARLQRQIDESHAALRRRREVISELNRRACDLTRENAELRKRAMPEGMEWPRYESGEPVRPGDKLLDKDGDWFKAVSFVFTRDWWSVRGYQTEGFGDLNDETRRKLEGMAYGTCVKRPTPKVLDADGAEIRVGDRVWSTQLDEPNEWIVIDPHGDRDDSQTVLVSIGDRTGHARPENLTHRAPVLAADGKPLREGETVYLQDGESFTVDFIRSDGNVAVRELSSGMYLRPERLTHERPDSWERIEEDAGCTATKYNERRGTTFTTKQQVARDLVRRCRALAERERGE